MSIAINLGLVIGSIAALLGIMAAVKALGRFGIGSETQRKLIHVATGLFAIALPFVFHQRWPVAVLLGLALVVMVLLRSPARAMAGLGSALHGVKRESHGEIYLVLAVGFLAFRVEQGLVFYVLPLLVLTLADAAAALVGVSYGRRKLQVEEGAKSVEGVVAFFTTTWLIAMILLLLMTDAPRPSVVLLSLMVAAFGAIVEVNSWKGLDNLFIPVGLHLFLVSHLDSPPVQLLVLAAGFLATAALVLTVAPRAKVSPHAAKAATVLIFLVCSVTAPHNAILPVVAILAHLAASRNRPCRSRHPDLDLLGVVAGVALLWLFVGEQFGVTAINMFNFTFAVGAAILLALAGRAWPIWITVPLIAAVAAGLLVVAQWNPAAAQWHGRLWLWTAIAMGGALALAWTLPALFDRYRSPRVFALALAAPLLLYAVQGIPR
jgi:dolichol kinase